jgi:hypothetical protein
MKVSRFAVLFAALTTAATVLAGPTAAAATIAHWNFETDLIAGSAAGGQTVSHGMASGAFVGAIADVSGNANAMSAFNDSWAGMQFSSNVPSLAGTGSTLSGGDQSNFSGFFTNGDLKVGGSDVGSLPTWTIEAWVNFDSFSGTQTFNQGIVGIDGAGAGAAPLYFQLLGASQQFRIDYEDVDGNRHVVNSTTAAALDTWYHVAATSDGSTLRLFVNGIQEGGDVALGAGNTALVGYNPAETGGDVAGWSLMRGSFGGGHVDRMRGYVDEVRISNVALNPSQFLIVPEPTSVVLLGVAVAGLAIGFRRR